MPNHLLDTLLPRSPNAACLHTPAGRIYSYDDIRALSARFASALAACAVGPGDRVAAQVEKSPEALLLYLACLRAGAVFLPLNPAYTQSEVAYFVADSRPSLLTVDPARRDGLAGIAAAQGTRLETLAGDGTGSLADLAARSSDGWRDIDRRPDDLAAILYTSGTTGRSKGAMLTHGNLRSNAEALLATWRFTPDDLLIHALPLFHTHGIFVAANVSLMAGASMHFLPRFDAEEVLALMPQSTVLMGVPTFYSRLLNLPGLTREAAAGMRLFVSGSAPLLAETHARFRERTGHAILERYGMTETGMNSSNPHDGERLPGSVGLPLPGIAIRIADSESGRELPPGEVGMIEVRGPNVFAGYWGMPEKTRGEFRADGFFVTGDLGRIDARGYLWIVGRAKDLVISGGFNIYPKEIELEIDALPGVAESAVIGLPHPDFGEAVTAIVVPADGSDLGEADIVGSLRARLAGYKLPKRVIFADELPRNAMAKVQKNLLREAHKDLYIGAGVREAAGEDRRRRRT